MRFWAPKSINDHFSRRELLGPDDVLLVDEGGGSGRGRPGVFVGAGEGGREGGSGKMSGGGSAAARVSLCADDDFANPV